MAELDQAPGRQCEWLYGGCAMTTRMTRTLFPPLLGYATCGLVLSLALHPGSLAGVQPPGGNVLFAGLLCGIFPLALALLLIARKIEPAKFLLV
jgi:hypothetical protein